MLRRLTLGFLLLACAAAVAACGYGTTTPSYGGTGGQGPNFVTNTIYVANAAANMIEIYTPAPGPSATPEFTLTSTSSLNGPQYLAFNSSKQLYVTNYNAATKASAIQIYQTYATGNVLPFNSIGLAQGQFARGITFMPNGDFAFTVTATGQLLASSLFVYDSTNVFTLNIAGSSTGLNAPVGVAADANNNLYVGNGGSSSVTVYALPTPSPSPSGSPSPSPSPAPTPTVNPSISPSPTPVPTPVSSNVAPIMTITNGLTTPMGIALDSKTDLFVADAGNSLTAPSIGIFDAPLKSGMLESAKITSSAFVDPTDVKVDASGTIYVVDAGNGPGTAKLLIFAPGTKGSVAPSTAIALPAGSAAGMALSP